MTLITPASPRRTWYSDIVNMTADDPFFHKVQYCILLVVAGFHGMAVKARVSKDREVSDSHSYPTEGLKGDFREGLPQNLAILFCSV